VLDLQNFSKGNNEQPTDGHEADREVNPIKEKNDKTENAPAQKNDNKNKHWKSSEIMSSHNTD